MSDIRNNTNGFCGYNNTNIGVKKSQFVGSEIIPNGSYFDFVVNGKNLRIKDTDFYRALNVIGSIIQDGDPLGVPVLDAQGSVNAIRNLSAGAGISLAVNPQNGITISSAAGTQSIVFVSSGDQLAGDLQSDVVYILDGAIDLGDVTITVPDTGLNIQGLGCQVSSLHSFETNHTMFSGGGSLNISDITITEGGTGSKVFDYVGTTGSENITLSDVVFNGCVDLGSIANLDQYVEDITRRINGTPSMVFDGNINQARIAPSLISGVDDTFSGAIFSAGALLSIAGRFSFEVNVDLGALAAFSDFSVVNFSDPSAFVINDSVFARNGALNADDSTILPNTLASDVESNFKNNVGIGNTFEGGKLTITSEVVTQLSGVPVNTFIDLEGVFTASFLDHFDQPQNNQLRNITVSPREYSVSINKAISGTASDLIELKVVKWDDSESMFVDVISQTRAVNNAQGSNDLAFFDMQTAVSLDINDFLVVQVANLTAARDVTALIDDFMLVSTR